MKSNKLIPLFLFILLPLISTTQVEKGYYLFPIKPGEQNFLAGNMSEIRPNHFHTGIDIKTEGREGLPVIAAASGHVYRMKISTSGYGNVLYLRHHNGQSTVYAHLRDFEEDIAAYMRGKMYEARQNEFEYFPEADELPVTKGDTIAYSGNTGSSGGPHLHFEIRDSLGRALDPLEFGFSEIIDKTPPTATRVAISPLEINSRINGEYQRKVFSVNYDGNNFRVNQPIRISGKVGIEILAYDKLDEMYNRNGFPVFEIYEDSQKIFESNVNSVDFNYGRFLLVHTYRNLYTRLYKTPNNLFDFYQPAQPLSGAIEAMPGEEKPIQVVMKDIYGNASRVDLNFKGEELFADLKAYNQTSGSLKMDYQNNILVINAPLSDSGDLAKFYVHGYEMEIPYSYKGTNKRTYLWDMHMGIPDSINLCTETIAPQVQAKIPFKEEVWFCNGRTQIYFRDTSLLDDLFLRLEHVNSESSYGITINDPYEYVWNPIEVSLNMADFSGNKERSHMYLKYENGYKSFVGGSWENDIIKFTTKNFGTFVLATDSVPPRVNPLRINKNEIRFSIGDNLSGIRDVEAWVDGNWVLMRYEHKKGLTWSEKKDRQPFKGEVVLKVRDMANNESIYRGKI